MGRLAAESPVIGNVAFYLYLVISGTVMQLPGHYSSREACMEVGRYEVEQLKAVHPHIAAWPWCFQGKPEDA